MRRATRCVYCDEPRAGLVEMGGNSLFLFHFNDAGAGVPAVVAAGEEAHFYFRFAGGQGAEVEVGGVGHFGRVIALVCQFSVDIDAEVFGVHASRLALLQGEGVDAGVLDVVGDIDAPLFVIADYLVSGVVEVIFNDIVGAAVEVAVVFGGSDTVFVVRVDIHGFLERFQAGFPVVVAGGVVALAVDVGQTAEPLLAALALDAFVLENFADVFDGGIKIAVFALKLTFRAALEAVVDFFVHAHVLPAELGTVAGFVFRVFFVDDVDERAAADGIPVVEQLQRLASGFCTLDSVRAAGFFSELAELRANPEHFFHDFHHGAFLAAHHFGGEHGHERAVRCHDDDFRHVETFYRQDFLAIIACLSGDIIELPVNGFVGQNGGADEFLPFAADGRIIVQPVGAVPEDDDGFLALFGLLAGGGHIRQSAGVGRIRHGKSGQQDEKGEKGGFHGNLVKGLAGEYNEVRNMSEIRSLVLELHLDPLGGGACGEVDFPFLGHLLGAFPGHPGGAVGAGVDGGFLHAAFIAVRLADDAAGEGGPVRQLDDEVWLFFLAGVAFTAVGGGDIQVAGGGVPLCAGRDAEECRSSRFALHAGQGAELHRGLGNGSALLCCLNEGLECGGRAGLLCGDDGFVVGGQHALGLFCVCRAVSRTRRLCRRSGKGLAEHGFFLAAAEFRHGPFQHLPEDRAVPGVHVNTEHAGEESFLHVFGEGAGLFLDDVRALDSPRGLRAGNHGVHGRIELNFLLVAHGADFLLQIAGHINGGKAILNIERDGLPEVFVPGIRCSTGLLHESVQFCAEEGVQGAVLQGRLPHFDGTGAVVARFQRTRGVALAVGICHGLVIAEHCLHERVGRGSLVAEDVVVHPAVRSAEAADPLAALNAVAVGTVTGLTHGGGGDAVCHAGKRSQVRERTAHTAVAVGGFRIAHIIGERHVVRAALHRIAEFGRVCIDGCPAGGVVLIPGQVDVFCRPCERLVIPVLPHDTDHEAQLPGAQLRIIWVQLVFPLLFQEEVVAPHRIEAGRIHAEQRLIRRGLTTAPQGCQCHGQRLVFHLAVLFFPDAVENIQPDRCLIGNQPAAQVELQPGRILAERFQKSGFLFVAGELSHDRCTGAADEFGKHGTVHVLIVLDIRLFPLERFHQVVIHRLIVAARQLFLNSIRQVADRLGRTVIAGGRRESLALHRGDVDIASG